VSIFSDDRANELRSIFFESSQEILQALNEDALLLEKSPHDAEIVRNLRRSVHTLKGDSAACGYKDLSELAHAVEDVLTAEVADREGEALVELVLVAADLFDNLLSAFRGNVQPPSTEDLYRLIERLRNPNAKPAEVAPKFHWSEYELLLISGNANGQPVYNLALTIDPSCPMRAAAVQLVRNVLRECGAILVMHPEEQATEIPDVIEVALSSALDAEAISRKVKIPTVISKVYSVLMDALKPTDPVPSKPEPASAPAHTVRGERKAPVAAEAERAAVDRPKARDDRTPVENVIRVETERVDTVLDLVGELIIAKSMMHDVVAEMSRALGNGPLRARGTDLLVAQSQILNKLQRAVMKIRMVPVEQMFRRLPRVARDTAKAVGHEVNVLIEGGNTDLDKSILDALAEPMMHLLRNAIDHGIEPPLERAAAGKPPEGTIRLSAYHQGNQVVIEISDDGAGINISKVLAKAVDRGLIAPEQAARLSDSDALDLIFHAGLSTSESVTEISGRGVGMDVVKSVMDRLKGTISVQTVAGQGTTFRLKVPLTLAIIKALLFKVSDRLYAVPLTNVLEILRSRESDVHSVDEQEVLQIRHEIVPIIRLSRMHPGGERSKKLFVVVVSLGDRKCGFVVDRLIGEQELVIKALDETMITSELISGASILGDGRVVLILSVSDVVQKLGRGTHRSTIESAQLELRR
jgi:two-component system chemotaxis sensor kinase CheA